MPQITTGQAVVTQTSTRIIAATSDVDWSDVEAGHIFSVPAARNIPAYAVGVLYDVDHTVAPNLSGSGKWEIFLTAPFSRISGVVFYEVTIDFEPVLGLPMIRQNDADAALLYDRAMKIIGQAFLTYGVTGAGVDQLRLGAMRVFNPDENAYRLITLAGTTAGGDLRIQISDSTVP